MRSVVILLVLLALAGSVHALTNINSCSNLSSPDEYVLTADLSGNNTYELGTTACIYINSSNVTLDCAGYLITGNESGLLVYGIVTDNSLSNISVKNCANVSNYSTGVFFNSITNGSITNNTASNNSAADFRMDSCTNITVTDNFAAATPTGFHVLLGGNNTISGNRAARSITSFWIVGSTYNNLSNNLVQGPANQGIYLMSSDLNNLSNNAATGTGYGFYIEFGSNNTLVNNTADSCSQHGFYVYLASDDNVFFNNSAYNNSGDGFCVYWGSQGNNLTENRAYNNSNGFSVQSSSGRAFIRENEAYDNSNSGFAVSSNSYYVNLTNNTAHDNFDGFYINFTSYVNLTNNVAFDNGRYGFHLHYCRWGALEDVAAYQNHLAGVHLWQSQENNISRMTSYGNAGTGLEVFDMSTGNNLSGIILHGNGIALNLNGSSPNNVSNVFIYNESFYLEADFFFRPATNFTNITFGYNESIGLLHYDVLNNISYLHLANTLALSNFILNPYFISVDTASVDAQQLNASANVTIFGNCSQPVLRAAGFQTSLPPILATGLIYPTDKTCAADIATFNISNFSGFALGQQVSQCTLLFNPPSPRTQGTAVNASCSCTNPEAPVTLWRNGLDVTLAENNIPTILPLGPSNYVCNVTSSQNYTNASTNASYIITPPPSGGGGAPSLSASLSSTCDGTLVTVRSGGSPVNGVDVSVENRDTRLSIFSGTTNGSGQVGFTVACDTNMRVYVNKGGYLPDTVTGRSADCASCAPPPPPPGCVPACGANYTCVGGVCVPITPPPPPPPPPECLTSDDCGSTAYCSGGACIAVTGCGAIENHVLVPYECGDEPGCPACTSGKTCEDHVCLSNNITGSDGFVGNTSVVHATENGGPCARCTVRIIFPDGRNLTGETDDNGDLSLPLSLQGAYRIELLKKGTPVSYVMIRALPVPTGGEERPPVTILDTVVAAMPWLFLLLLIIIAVIVYMRRRKKKPRKLGE